MGSTKPKNGFVTLKGKQYLQVNHRVQWFRDEHEHGCITTEVVSWEPLAVKATVFDGEGRVLGCDHASAKPKAGAVYEGRELEKACTAAIGRALALAGYGTLAALKEDLEGDHLSDSPVERRNGNGHRDTRTDAQRLGSGGDRRVTTTTNEAPKPQADDDLSDRDVASRFIQRWRSQSLSDSEVLAALGVTKLSEWTKGRKAADAAVNTWLAGHLAPEADEQQPPPTTQLGEFQQHEAHGVVIQKLAKQPTNHSYVIKCFGGVNIVTYSGDVFRKAGMSETQLDMWKKLGKWDFDTKVYVYARQVTNSKGNVTWEIERVDFGKEALTEMDKQFASI